jgi:hypothetical protein
MNTAFVYTQPRESQISLTMRGSFCSSDRYRIVYTVVVDGREVGVAICWTSPVVHTWSLAVPEDNVPILGFRTVDVVLAAILRFVRTGEAGR